VLFRSGDPLWLPYGEERDKVIDKMISLKNRYRNFVINDIKQLGLLKRNWGGIGTTPVNCPSWIILPLDHKGRIKEPCCIGSADGSGTKPICEDCGLSCYSIFLAKGFKGSP